MKKTLATVFVTLAATAMMAAPAGSSKSCLPAFFSEKPVIEKEIKELAPGVVYEYRYFKNLFGDGPVAFYALVIDWGKAKGHVTLAIGDSVERRMRTSELAKAGQALAAVNGFYHTTQDPSLSYFPQKIAGKSNPSKNQRGDTALAFNKGGPAVVGKWTQELYDKYENCVSGDGLMGPGGCFRDNAKSAATKEGRQKMRAPRTFTGVSTNGMVTYICVADGRTRESVGLSYGEVAECFRQLGCAWGVANDGGGSSSMVLKKNGYRPVNRPSDNGKFDEGGERRVNDALLIVPLHPLPPDLPPPKALRDRYGR